MEQEHDLSDEQCDRLVAVTMDVLAAKVDAHAFDLNRDIMEHHTLRRSIVRVAYNLGKAAEKVPNAEIERLRAALIDALEVGSHLMSAASHERARRLLVPNEDR